MIRVLTGDCRALLATLPAASVQCCVTSPPYYGLRDYGTAIWEGGDAGCDHAPDKRGSRFATPVSSKQASNTGSGSASSRDCPCGARRVDAQIGLEASPDEYVAALVDVMREVRRVLRSDGTLWLNLGDSYAGAGYSNHTMARNGSPLREDGGKQRHGSVVGIKSKDLLMIPVRVALALQADGWWLRSDIIWAKKSCMPESVTDRPTSAHEHVFLLAKSARYFFDADAVAETATRAGDVQTFGSEKGRNYQPAADDPNFRNGHEQWGRTSCVSTTRNIRNVWTIATASYSDSHFAVMPTELAERCIKAGSKPGDTVLDPFAGAGTTLLVADQLQRHAVGIELNPAYAAMASNRVRDDAPLLAEVAD